MSDASLQQKIEQWRQTDPAGYKAAVSAVMAKPLNSLQMMQAPTTAALQAGVITPADLQGTDENLSVDANGIVGPHQQTATAAKIAGIGTLGLATAGALAPVIAGGGAGAAAGGAGAGAGAGGTAAGTGGGILSSLGTKGGLMAASTILGNAAKGSSQNDAISQNLALGKGNLALNTKKYADAAPGTRLRTGILASLAANATPATVKWNGPGSGLRGEIPQFSGGMDSIYSALNNPQAKQLANSSLDEELSNQLNQQDSSLGDASSVGQESMLSKLLGAGALGTGVLSLFRNQNGPTIDTSNTD